MAPFQLDVGTDLFGTKFNTTLKFAEKPRDYEGLIAAVESYFDTKSRAVRPAGYPDVPFRVESFQVFQDSAGQWVDLAPQEMHKLYNQQQVWGFQNECIWHSDAQGVIPNSDPHAVSFTWTTPLGSPRRRRQASDAGVPPTLSEKLRSVFYATDSGNKGHLTLGDLEMVFRRCEMHFTERSANELFYFADLDKNKLVSYDEFVNFSLRCPNVIDALFFRLRDMRTGANQYDSQRSPAPPQAAVAYAPPSLRTISVGQSSGAPEWVRVRGGRNGCDGDYRIAEGQFEGSPHWVSTEGTRFLYSTPEGHWMITDSGDNFDKGCGWVTTVNPHNGRWPQDITDWEQQAHDPDGSDPQLIVEEARVVQTTRTETVQHTPQTTVKRIIVQHPPPHQQAHPQPQPAPQPVQAPPPVQTVTHHVQHPPQQYTSPPAPPPQQSLPHQTIQYVSHQYAEAPPTRVEYVTYGAPPAAPPGPPPVSAAPAAVPPAPVPTEMRTIYTNSPAAPPAPVPTEMRTIYTHSPLPPSQPEQRQQTTVEYSVSHPVAAAPPPAPVAPTTHTVQYVPTVQSVSTVQPPSYCHAAPPAPPPAQARVTERKILDLEWVYRCRIVIENGEVVSYTITGPEFGPEVYTELDQVPQLFRPLAERSAADAGATIFGGGGSASIRRETAAAARSVASERERPARESVAGPTSYKSAAAAPHSVMSARGPAPSAGPLASVGPAAPHSTSSAFADPQGSSRSPYFYDDESPRRVNVFGQYHETDARQASRGRPDLLRMSE